ncbi:hypothetical protein [Streptomyces sp. ISL-86]|uniref:hypothetical protein n=1 Tax=Streptomyces sp. ISL-86 TaxID=2819187 RepID=UPI001BEB8E0C|nr:hypothetical protein [Streptomyces sp. ISL-86]MBT2453331.1 hypothetical protein [Streptomyces sp. ISL-86]
MARKSLNHAAVAEAAKAVPGQWVLAGTYPASANAATMANCIRKAVKVPAYAPGGTFEAYSAMAKDGWAVWTRFVAFVRDLKPRPESMTYRVCDRGSGREYVGVRVVTATVAAECPTCGGPRGEATPFRFCEDGEWYDVSRWTNPCGHVDMYAAILREHRRRQEALEAEEQKEAARALKAGPVDAGPFTGAVVMLNAASAELCGLTARQAAQYLGRHGHDEAARLIEEELGRRAGERWSGRKAAVWLAEVGAALVAGTFNEQPAPGRQTPVVEQPPAPKKARRLPKDTRPVGVVAHARIQISDNPRRFQAGVARTLTAIDQGEDPATAGWTAVDPVKTAAEIEALAGLRRLSDTRKDAK